MEYTEEIFREMIGWPGYYASNLGRIISFKRSVPKFLSLKANRLGFIMVQVFQDSRAKFLSVAREVLAAFYGYPADPWLCVAKHKNGDLSDCRLENLEWVICQTTPDYNPSKSLRRGILKAEHTKAKMTESKFNQSMDTIEKANAARKRNLEYRKKFRSVNDIYNIQNRFRTDE